MTTTNIAMNFYRRGVKTIIIKPDGSRVLERKEAKVPLLETLER